MASETKGGAGRAVMIAWLVTAAYYFYQYVMRSAPAVMMPQLSSAFGLSCRRGCLAGRSLLLRLFAVQPGRGRGDGPARAAQGGSDRCRGWSALARCCSRRAIRCWRARDGFLQGAGGVFALVGAAYIATTNFPASRAATLIGATQMFGMAGGSAGQFVVGPLIAAGVAWNHFWSGMGVAGLAIAALLVALLPKRAADGQEPGLVQGSGRCAGPGVPQSAVDPLRGHRRADVHPHHDLRHGLGRALPAGGARIRVRRGGAALGDGPVRLDHRLPAARVPLRPHRPAQAGHHRRRAGAARLPGLDSLRAGRMCSRPIWWAWWPAWPRAPRCSRTR